MRTLLPLLVAGLICPSAARATESKNPAALTALIDSRLDAEWKKAGVQHAPISDDQAFLRRASLDLIGRIPTVAEVRDFLADKSLDKKAKLLTRLIASGGHSRHMATFWRRTCVPQADTPEYARLADDFESWMAMRLQENAPYDQIVRELLTLPSGSGRRSAVSPGGFFAASDNKPENLAANATRAFLGVNLDCAQCHNHPFARWTREQFWQTAAFFSQPKQVDGGRSTLPEVTIPNTNKTLRPVLLDGAQVKWPQQASATTGRELLANWLVAKDNPFFAKNTVNRLWEHHFGTALVEPLDDLSGDSGNSGVNADLLKELADAFAASGFDLKLLTHAIVMTRAYQLSAVAPTDTPSDPQLFARMPIRGLSGEQLYDSLRTAAGLPPERADTERGQGLEGRKRFTARFHVERPIHAQRSITQALAMMNGRLTNDLADPAKNSTLGGVVNAPFLNTKGKIETLFLAVLGRTPSANELETMAAHVEGASDSQRARALGDLVWILANSTEFNTNH